MRWIGRSVSIVLKVDRLAPTDDENYRYFVKNAYWSMCVDLCVRIECVGRRALVFAYWPPHAAQRGWIDVWSIWSNVCRRCSDNATNDPSIYDV